MARPCQLYRCFAKDGVLLYVGHFTLRTNERKFSRC